MKKILLTVLAFLIPIFCLQAKQKKTKTKASSKEIISVKLHHGACYGKCPDYFVEVNKSGLVTYTGRLFVTDSGVYQKSKPGEAKKVLALFSSYRVDTCKDSYPNRIPDLSGLYYEINYKTGVKKVYNAQFGPGFLKGELTDAMNEIGKVDKSWKHVTKSVKK